MMCKSNILLSLYFVRLTACIGLMTACVEEVDLNLSNQVWLEDQGIFHQNDHVDLSSTRTDMILAHTDMVLAHTDMVLAHMDADIKMMNPNSIDMMFEIDMMPDMMMPDMMPEIEIMMPEIEAGNLQINELNLITESEPFIEIYNPLLYQFAFDDFSIDFYQIQVEPYQNLISDPDFLGHVNRCGYQQDLAYYACSLSDIQDQLSFTNQDQMSDGIIVVMVVFLSYQNLVLDGLLISDDQTANEQVYFALYEDIYLYFPNLHLIDGFDLQMANEFDSQEEEDYSLSRCSQRQDFWDFFALKSVSMNRENFCSSH